MSAAFDAVGEGARGRFVRWDAALFAEVGRGPFAALEAALGADDPLLASYARLAAEAIGRGTLFPARAGARSFVHRAFFELLPAWLPTLAPRARAELLRDVFNLGENVEASPGWMKRLLEAQLATVESPGALREVVGAVGARLSATPERGLEGAFSVCFVPLTGVDPRFLPGAVCFLAPLVGLVRGRGTDEAYALWLGELPEVLGPAEWPKEPARELPEEAALAAWQRADPRFTPVHDVAATPHRALATLATSQLVVVVMPA